MWPLRMVGKGAFHWRLVLEELSAVRDGTGTSTQESLEWHVGFPGEDSWVALG